MKHFIDIGRPNRNFAFVALLFTLLTAEVNIVNAAADTSFLPFESFLQVTQKAELSNYSDLKQTKVSDPAEFRRMKKHILTMYKGVIVKNSFSFDKNNHVDCVDIYTQPGLNKDEKQFTLQKPPPAMDMKIDENTAQAKSVSNMLTQGKKDAHGNHMFCEQGYIPMRRITLDEMVRFPTLEDFFNKYGVRGTEGDPTMDKE